MARKQKPQSDKIKVSETELAIVRQKAMRAGKHFEVAQRMFRRFVRNECGVRAEFSTRTQQYNAVAHLPPPPPVIGLLVGDCVHNLRSALDHIVYALISTNPTKPEGVPDSRTMFPIRDTKEGYLHQVTKLRRIHGTPDAVAALIDSLQPYHARDKGLDYTAHPLWVLDKLENIDKHRRLMLASGVARHAHVSIRYSDGGETDLMIMQDRIYDRAILTSYPPGADGEVQMNGYLMVYIALREVDELPSLVDEDIFHILAQLLDYVGNLLMPRFARLAVGHATPPKKRRRQDFRPVLRGRRTGAR